MSQRDQLTLRGLEPRVHQAIRALARRERTSLNKAAVRLLEKGAGIGAAAAEDRIGTSLDHLIGTWSGREAKALLASIAPCEQIDRDLWG